MNDRVVYPDATELVATYLRIELDPVHVGSRIPNPRPDTFVTITRGGGIPLTPISEAPLLLIECWALTTGEAHDLIQEARSYLHVLEGTVLDGVPIYRVNEVGGPQELPDDVSDQARYVMTIEVHLRGAVPAS